MFVEHEELTSLALKNVTVLFLWDLIILRTLEHLQIIIRLSSNVDSGSLLNQKFEIILIANLTKRW